MMDTSVHLVQYGRPGFLGRFRGSHALSRGDRVLIRSPRGLEIGEVLLPGDSRQTGVEGDGDLLRAASPGDDLELEDLNQRGQDLLASAMVRAEAMGLPLAFVDVEVMLDGVAVLHALPWAECDATALLDHLAEASGLAVRLLDLSRGPRPEPSTGCGKPGCGSEGGCSSCGGGCASGSCSRGAVKSPEELTTYFADLRKKMEAAGLARKSLN